ncbi:MAG: hypothetical protein PVF66_03795 [Candidatus Aminicenantes bacterium]
MNEKALDRRLSINYLSLKNHPLYANLRTKSRFHKTLEIQKQKYEERFG